MNKKTLIVVFTLFAMLFGACSFNINMGDINLERGSGNVITETREVSDFDEVSLSGIGDVILTQGESTGLSIEAEDNILPYIKTEVRSGTLYISYESNTLFPTEPIRFNLSMRDVRGLETLGVSNIRSDRIVTDQLDISISGTGNININDLQADKLLVKVSGAGNFNAEGLVEDQTVTLSGAGNYNGEDLESKTADITISGLGKVSVWVTDTMKVNISGTGGVDYYGSPRITQNISGIGDLNNMGNK